MKEISSNEIWLECNRADLYAFLRKYELKPAGIRETERL
jgi:hypothetical protein